MDASEIAETLRKLGYTVVPPVAPRELKPLPACSVCGAVSESALYYPATYDVDAVDDDTPIADWLTKIRVDVGVSGEEGWDFKSLLFCGAHDAQVIAKLQELGFVTHHHGSTHPLADEHCPGEVDIAQCPVYPDEFVSPYDVPDIESGQ